MCLTYKQFADRPDVFVTKLNSLSMLQYNCLWNSIFQRSFRLVEGHGSPFLLMPIYRVIWYQDELTTVTEQWMILFRLVSPCNLYNHKACHVTVFIVVMFVSNILNPLIAVFIESWQNNDSGNIVTHWPNYCISLSLQIQYAMLAY